MATATKNPKASDKQLRAAASIFDMASDPTRLKILLALDCEEDVNVGNLAALTNQSQPAVSHHLSLMRHGRFVEAIRRGKNNIYKLLPLGETVVKTYSAVLEG